MKDVDALMRTSLNANRIWTEQGKGDRHKLKPKLSYLSQYDVGSLWPPGPVCLPATMQAYFRAVVACQLVGVFAVRFYSWTCTYRQRGRQPAYYGFRMHAA